MRYIVDRVSIICDDDKPIEECIRATVSRIDERTFKSPEEYNNRINFEKWQDSGYGHHINNKGHIVRYENDEKWVIEINTLEELHAFVKKYGDVILSSDYFIEPRLTIYDDYIE